MPSDERTDATLRRVARAIAEQVWDAKFANRGAAQAWIVASVPELVGLVQNYDAAVDLLRQWGDGVLCYSATQTLLSHLEGVEELDRRTSAYPPNEQLRHLADATRHLLRDHDCDHDGWEIWDAALDAALSSLDKGARDE